MRLDEREKKMFESLSQSEAGKALVDYLKKLCNELSDIRNLKNLDDSSVIQARLAAVKTLEENVINKIKNPTPEKGDDNFN